MELTPLTGRHGKPPKCSLMSTAKGYVVTICSTKTMLRNGSFTSSANSFSSLSRSSNARAFPENSRATSVAGISFFAASAHVRSFCCRLLKCSSFCLTFSFAFCLSKKARLCSRLASTIGHKPSVMKNCQPFLPSTSSTYEAFSASLRRRFSISLGQAPSASTSTSRSSVCFLAKSSGMQVSSYDIRSKFCSETKPFKSSGLGAHITLRRWASNFLRLFSGFTIFPCRKDAVSPTMRGLLVARSLSDLEPRHR
mmetsp:Transcript_18652/g.32393  ORF Transcript_18652/g.32393 Transcript_18652/m.32393 type:complete len:253 (-) Transcript_18652:179-937(-)